MDLILFILIVSMTIVLGTTYGVLNFFLRRFGVTPWRTRAVALVASALSAPAWFFAVGIFVKAFLMTPILMSACGPVDGFMAANEYYLHYGPGPTACGNSVDDGLRYCTSVDPAFLASWQGQPVPVRPTSLPEG